MDGTVVLDEEGRPTTPAGPLSRSPLSSLEGPRSIWNRILARGGVALAVVGVIMVLGVIGLVALGGALVRAPALGPEDGGAAQVAVEAQPGEEGTAETAEEAIATLAPGAAASSDAESAAAATARAALIEESVVVFRDDFGSNANGWSVGEASDDYGDYLDEMSDGKFRLSAVSKQPTWNWTWVPDISTTDLWLRVDATLVQASGEAVVGISFRENKNGYYYVEFANDGSYRVRSREDESWSTIQSWTASDAFSLEPGVANTFAVLAEGPNITIYANDQELTTVRDLALTGAGIISLIGALPQADQSIVVDFDNLVIKEVPVDKTVAEIESTATASAAVKATTQAEPSVTARARETQLANAVVTFEDDFGSNVNGWWVGESSDEYGDYTGRVVDGKYRLSMASKQPSWSWRWVPDYSARDFWLSVEATIVDSSAEASVFISFRENKNGDTYRVQFASDGTYRVTLFQDGEWSVLQAWQSSDAIRLEPGVTSAFAVLAEGPNFKIYANGQEVAMFQDSALSESGKISLAIGLNREDQTVTVDFDNLIIKEL
jgi:hypothetical protein